MVDVTDWLWFDFKLFFEDIKTNIPFNTSLNYKDLQGLQDQKFIIRNFKVQDGIFWF